MQNRFDVLGAVFLAFAVLHTFSVKYFLKLATRFAKGSTSYTLFHALGEVEIAFGAWAILLVLVLFALGGGEALLTHLGTLQFTEPLFVAVITLVAATTPILSLASSVLKWAAGLIPLLPPGISFLLVLLTVGPLLGSLMTEPAAMTVTALVLRRYYFSAGISQKCRYAILASLLVNISIGGVLTHFAAPPVVMVARIWGWSTKFMFTHFGWKAVIAVTLNACILVYRFRKELVFISIKNATGKSELPPYWVVILSLSFAALVVTQAHHPLGLFFLLAVFAFYFRATKRHQSLLKAKESALVGFFLAGVVVVGSFQSWWVMPVIQRLSASALFIGATLLTSITDNAALTYLGAQVPGLGAAFQYMLVAGAVVGGGLTVIANAPNPIGFAILGEAFESPGIDAVKMLAEAVGPTLVAGVLFYFL